MATGKHGGTSPPKKASATGLSGNMTNADLRKHGLVNMHTVIPEELHRRIKIYAVTYGLTIRELMIQALEDRLKKK